jgi:hypothetical protein
MRASLKRRAECARPGQCHYDLQVGPKDDVHASKTQAVLLLQNQTTVLLLPFIRGEGRDEGLGFGVRG